MAKHSSARRYARSINERAPRQREPLREKLDRQQWERENFPEINRQRHNDFLRQRGFPPQFLEPPPRRPIDVPVPAPGNSIGRSRSAPVAQIAFAGVVRAAARRGHAERVAQHVTQTTVRAHYRGGDFVRQHTRRFT